MDNLFGVRRTLKKPTSAEGRLMRSKECHGFSNRPLRFDGVPNSPLSMGLDGQSCLSEIRFHFVSGVSRSGIADT